MPWQDCSAKRPAPSLLGQQRVFCQQLNDQTQSQKRPSNLQAVIYRGSSQACGSFPVQHGAQHRRLRFSISSHHMCQAASLPLTWRITMEMLKFSLLVEFQSDRFLQADFVFLQGQFLASYPFREDIFTATKYCVFHPMTVTREAVRANVAERCRRLQTERIDLLKFHWQFVSPESRPCRLMTQLHAGH